MKIVVASGKGGTGKSMLSSSLSLLFGNNKKVVACDCDVDAPNLGLWLGVTDYDNIERISIAEKAVINTDTCTNCGACYENCRFEAIEKTTTFSINPLTCEGCGVCQLVCPVDAVDLKPVINGELQVTQTKWRFPLVSGQIYPGATGSGKIVQQLRRKAEQFYHDVMILDAAAGIGCPVIASLTGCDFAVLVVEPTPSSYQDLHRILELINHFQLPYGIIINKWTLNPRLSLEIQKWSEKHFLGKLSYNKIVITSILNLRPVVTSKSSISHDITTIFKVLQDRLQ